MSNLCISTCDHGTYSQGGACVTNCTGTNIYADPNNHLCASSCTGGLYGDPTKNKCVETCSTVGYYRDTTFFCKNNCNPRYADNITQNCVTKCSNGTWGYNFQCVSICPPGFYGYLPDRMCYDIPNIPDPDLFADNVTQTWVSICVENDPVLMFGDVNEHKCVENCLTHADYFADPDSQ